MSIKRSKTSTNQWVAIKFLSLNTNEDELKKTKYVQRFNREMDFCRRLQHPNIVRLLDKGQCKDGNLYAVFEYIQGQTLKDQLEKNGALNPNLAVDIMSQILDALSYAHEIGVIHRNI